MTAYTGRAAVAEQEARALWASPTARADWQVGELVVPPDVDAVLVRLEAAEMAAEHKLTATAARWIHG